MLAEGIRKLKTMRTIIYKGQRLLGLCGKRATILCKGSHLVSQCQWRFKSICAASEYILYGKEHKCTCLLQLRVEQSIKW